MTAVAIRLVLTAFTSTPGNLFVLLNDFYHRIHAGLAVRPVTEGLFLGITAGTPGIAARFHVHDKWRVLGVGEFIGLGRLLVWHFFIG